MRKGLLAALAFAAMAAAGPAGAEIKEVDFTVSGWTPGFASVGPPLGVDVNSPSSGSFWYDDAGHGASAITAINWDVGDYTFSMADLSYNPSITWLIFDPTTGVSSFSLGLRHFGVEPSYNGEEEFGAEVSLGPMPDMGVRFGSLARIYSFTRVITPWMSGEDPNSIRRIVSNDVVVSPPLHAPPVQASVPEPSIWAMLLLGFGLLGATLRTARRGEFQ